MAAFGAPATFEHKLFSPAVHQAGSIWGSVALSKKQKQNPTPDIQKD